MIRPNECGDTIFADTHAAYHDLPHTTKQQLHGLHGHYCYLKLRELSADGKAENLDIAEIQSAAGCAVHPLVTTHPITGVKNLYANPSHTASVLGYEKEASEALLQQLFAHTAQEKYAFRHVYQDNDLILWDNRGSSVFIRAILMRSWHTVLFLFFASYLYLLLSHYFFTSRAPPRHWLPQ